MRKILTFVFSCIAVLSWAQTKDYCLKVGEFTEFTVADNVNVVYKASTDSAGYATFTAPASITSAFTFSNNKNKLKIELIHDQPIPVVPTVTIYSMALTKVTNWGDSTITIARSNPGAELKAKVIGNGEIVMKDVHSTKIEAAVETGNGHLFLSGKAQSAKYTNMGTGSIEAAQLEAAKVKAVMLGTGDIDCWVTESLSVVGTGSGHVYYKGNPESVKNRGLGVKVDHIAE